MQINGGLLYQGMVLSSKHEVALQTREKSHCDGKGSGVNPPQSVGYHVQEVVQQANPRPTRRTDPCRRGDWVSGFEQAEHTAGAPVLCETFREDTALHICHKIKDPGGTVMEGEAHT